MSKTSRVRFEIRLPIYYNDGKEIDTEQHEQTINEIYEKFGAFTFLTLTEGSWRNPETNESYREKMGGFFIDVDKEKLDDAIVFFKQHKEIWKERFKQQEIYIVHYEIHVI